MRVIVRRDLTEKGILIPSVNTDELYTDEMIAEMKFISWVNRVTYDDDWDGELAQFKSPKGHVVFLYDEDLEFLWDENPGEGF